MDYVHQNEEATTSWGIGPIALSRAAAKNSDSMVCTQYSGRDLYVQYLGRTADVELPYAYAP